MTASTGFTLEPYLAASLSAVACLVMRFTIRSAALVMMLLGSHCSVGMAGCCTACSSLAANDKDPS